MSSNRSLFLAAAVALLTLGGTCNTPPPQQRPGAPFDGSVHWARDIAQPLIQNFAADAQIYNVAGVQVYGDGRLPANVGSWGIVAWSPSRQEEFQVNVRHTGATSTSVRAQTSPPSSDGQPVPAGWVNSTVVFAATAPHRDPSATVATLTVFNIATYDNPVWGINFSSAGAEPNHFVSWDGNYLGTTP